MKNDQERKRGQSCPRSVGSCQVHESTESFHMGKLQPDNEYRRPCSAARSATSYIQRPVNHRKGCLHFRLGTLRFNLFCPRIPLRQIPWHLEVFAGSSDRITFHANIVNVVGVDYIGHTNLRRSCHRSVVGGGLYSTFLDLFCHHLHFGGRSVLLSLQSPAIHHTGHGTLLDPADLSIHIVRYNIKLWR